MRGLWATGVLADAPFFFPPSLSLPPSPSFSSLLLEIKGLSLSLLPCLSSSLPRSPREGAEAGEAKSLHDVGSGKSLCPSTSPPSPPFLPPSLPPSLPASFPTDLRARGGDGGGASKGGGRRGGRRGGREGRGEVREEIGCVSSPSPSAPLARKKGGGARG